MITRAEAPSQPRPRPRRVDPRVHIVGWAAVLLTAATALLVSQAWALLFLSAAAAAWYLVPPVGRLALRVGAAGLPGGRSIHAERTPLLGGLAIFVPFAVYLAVAGGPESLGLLFGAGLMVAVGVWDDVRGVAPRIKVLAQVVAALVLFACGYRAPALSFPPLGTLDTTGVEILAVTFWVVLVTNAFNLIDGMDGLAASCALVGAVACAASGHAVGPALVLAGGTLGFLRHNLPRATVFLGDAGSLLLGFSVAAFLVRGDRAVNVPLTLGVLALPLGDVAIATLRRVVRGKPIFSGDRRHVHHRLLHLWKRPAAVLAGLVGLATAQAALAVLLPEARGLAAAAGLWALALGYLVVRMPPHWARILIGRKSFRRLHLARSYALGALRLAESPGDVEATLRRVADDLDLAALRVRDVRVERPCPEGAVQIEEHVDCGRTTASWSAPFRAFDPVFAEERRTVLCELLRHAGARLERIEPAPAAVPLLRTAPAPPPVAVPADAARPCVHFVADSRERLRRLTPFVEETRRRGLLEPCVVYTGRRDDMGITDAQIQELALARPDVELDVTPATGIVQTTRIMERYHALLGANRPAVVVVGDSRASVACALAAKEHGIPVAQVGGAARAVSGHATRPFGRSGAESIADVVLAPDHRPADAGDARRQLHLSDELAVDPDAAQLMPALEALLVR